MTTPRLAIRIREEQQRRDAYFHAALIGVLSCAIDHRGDKYPEDRVKTAVQYAKLMLELAPRHP